MNVRLAIESDHERLRAFDAWNQATIERIQAGECFVTEHDGVVAAYAVVNRNFFDRPFVAYLFVDPDHRRAGLCDALLAHVEANTQGPKLWISTMLTNTPMQGALEKRGYTMSGVVHDLGDAPELIYYKRRND